MSFLYPKRYYVRRPGPRRAGLPPARARGDTAVLSARTEAALMAAVWLAVTTSLAAGWAVGLVFTATDRGWFQAQPWPDYSPVLLAMPWIWPVLWR